MVKTYTSLSKERQIIFCSTSFFEYDRRMQRITSAVAELEETKVDWISRSYAKKNKDTLENIIIRPAFKSGPLFYLEFNLRLLWKLIFKPFDIVCAVDLDTLWACTIAAKLKRKSMFFDAHEIYYEVPELHGKTIKKSIWKSLAKWAIPKTEKAYTVNGSLKIYHEKHYKQDFSVIRNVPSSSEAKVNTNNFEKKTLVYLGVLNRARGIETVIDALPLLPDYKLLLIGDGDITQELKDRANRINVNDQIIFAGYKAPEEINTLLGDCSVGVNLLEAYSENYRLSLANKFFDYMHAGIPSINMDFPEYEKLVSEYEIGLTIKELSSDRFVQAVKKLEDTNFYTHSMRIVWHLEKSFLGKMKKSNSKHFMNLNPKPFLWISIPFPCF